ncbi:MAG: glycosyltransferase [Candidatus Parvarchaeota archaeon]
MKRSAVITSFPINSGIGRYANLLYGLGYFSDFLFYRTSAGSQKGNFTGIVQYSGRFTGLVSKQLSLWNRHNRWLKAIENMDFVHFADPDFFHLAKYRENTVGTIHDLFFLQENTKHFYPILNRMYYSSELNSAHYLDAVVTISNVSKRQIIEFYPNIDPIVVKLWTDASFRPRDKLNARIALDLPRDKFILLNVSGDYPRKNIELLPKIMNSLDRDYLMVRIGESERIINLFENNNFIYHRVVSNELYPLYFNAADAVILTSKEEGFGIPVIEAINSNVPLVLSNTDIFKEIVGNYQFYADPDSPEEWVEKIKVLKNKYDNGDKFLTRIYKHLEGFYTEERARAEYSSIYRKYGFI